MSEDALGLGSENIKGIACPVGRNEHMAIRNSFKAADAFILRQHQRLSDQTTAWWGVDCLVLARAAILFFTIASPFVMLALVLAGFTWLSIVLFVSCLGFWGDSLDRLRLVRKRLAAKEMMERDGHQSPAPSVPGSNMFIRLLYFVGGVVVFPVYMCFVLFSHRTLELDIVSVSAAITLVMFMGLSSADWFLFCIPRSRPPKAA